MCNHKLSIPTDLLIACCNKLDISFNDAITYSLKNFDSQYAVIKEQYEQYVLTQQYNKLNILCSKLDLNIPIHSQLYYKIKAVIESELNSNHLYAIDLYVKAIKIIIPDFNLKNFNIKFFKLNELTILYNIAIEYKTLGLYEKAISLYLTIINQLEINQSKYNLVYQLYYELSEIYLFQKKYDKAKELCLKGIQYGKENLNYISFGFLYYNLSLSNIMLNQINEGISHFNLCILFFKFQNRTTSYINQLKLDFIKECDHKISLNDLSKIYISDMANI